MSSNQSMSNAGFSNVNVTFKAPKYRFWFMVKQFITQANPYDLMWLERFLKKHDNKLGGIDKPHDGEEFMARCLLHERLQFARLRPPLILNNEPYEVVVFGNNGREIIHITRKTLKSLLPNCNKKSLVERLLPTQARKISYDFIERAINLDDTFSHLKGLTPYEINTYLLECNKDNSLENMKIQQHKLRKKYLKYTNLRNRYKMKKKRATLKYRKCMDISLLLEKFNSLAE